MFDVTITSRRRPARAPHRWTFLALALALAAGCGGADPADLEVGRPAEPDLTDVTGDRFAVAVTNAGEGAAVIEGGAGVEGTSRPRPVLTWLADDESAGERHVLPLEVPLFDVSTWWTGTEVAVMGLPCATWSARSQPPDVGEDGAPFLADLCGSSRYILGLWDPAEDSWRLEDGPDLQSDDGITIRSVAGDRALVTRATVDERTSGRSVTLSVLDLASGTVDEVPSTPTLPTDPDASFTACLSEHGLLGLLVWESVEPEQITSREIDAAHAVAAEPLPGRSQTLLAVVAEGDSWVPIPVTGGTTGAAVSPVCTAAGPLVTDGAAAAVLEGGGGSASWRPVSNPPGPGAHHIVRAQQGSGPPLQIELVDPARDAPPDAPRSSSARQLIDGAWEPVEDIPYTTGWEGATAGPHVLGLLPVASSTIQGAVRLVRS